MTLATAATICFSYFKPPRPSSFNPPPHMPDASILIVDDYEMVREGLRALITTEPGWEVCGETASGREAVAMATALKPAIIIMDLLIPELNGLDATRQIRKALPATEILVLSAHEDTEMIRAAFDAGARAYLFKTETREHLIPAIHSILAQQPYLTARVSEALFSRLGQGAAPDNEVYLAQLLTARERETIQLLAEGRGNKEIAAALAISVKTVDTHRAAIMRKLRLQSLSELIHFAIRARIIEA